MLLAVNFPAWLSPEIVPGLPFRWYGLMYLFAFGVTYLLFRRQVRERAFPLDDDGISSLFFYTILGLLLGARIFATIVYDTSGIYLAKPWLVFWPFDGTRFVGLQGMSYHGGLIGATIGVFAFSRARHYRFREIGDLLAAGIPLGYTFGRLGNFINGELYGRVTAGPLGMIFPHAERFSARLEWVRRIADQAGIAIPSPDALLNLPRHPSQLYEAFFEGIVLWAILWLLRKRKPFPGFLIGMYVIGYGLIRFVIEYFREPDADLGYRIELVKTGLPPALFSSLFNFSTGQILCFLMILGGGIWLLVAARLPDRDALPGAGQVAPDLDERKAHAAAGRQERRKLRKKLK